MRLRPDISVRAPELSQLAKQLDIDGKTLDKTIRDWNERAATPLGPGPWVALGPLRAYFTTTEGGAANDQQLRVLDEAGQIIPGLFAVGQNGLGGMILWGHGLHIGWALTSGRLVGASIMSDGGG